MNPTILPNIHTTIGSWLGKIMEVIILWIQWNREATMMGLLWLQLESSQGHLFLHWNSHFLFSLPMSMSLSLSMLHINLTQG